MIWREEKKNVLGSSNLLKVIFLNYTLEALKIENVYID